MKTIVVNEWNLAEVQATAPKCVIALGYFDGVHIGHQQVIKTALHEAKCRQLPLALMSFKIHPINVLSKGERSVENLMTITSKEKKLAQLGVDYFYLVDFTNNFANLSPKEFVEQYLVKLGVEHAVAGFDYSYGAKGAGKLNALQRDSGNRISVTELQCVSFRNEKVSSTAIRKRLTEKRVHEIPHFLGHHYVSEVNLMHRTFTVLGSTMLPNPGCYKVILKNGHLQVPANVWIDERGNIACLHRLPETCKGNFFMEWVSEMKNIALINSKYIV